MNQKDFKALKEFWYQKLKETGFEDIETEFGLKEWDSSIFMWSKQPVEIFLAKQEYHYKAGHITTELMECPIFLINTIDRLTWALHSEGFSLREISYKLQDHGFKIGKDTVQKILNTIKKNLWTEVP